MTVLCLLSTHTCSPLPVSTAYYAAVVAANAALAAVRWTRDEVHATLVASLFSGGQAMREALRTYDKNCEQAISKNARNTTDLIAALEVCASFLKMEGGGVA